MTHLDRLRERVRERARTRLPELVDQVDWPREKLDAFREKALRTVLARAISESRWHRERLGGIDTERFTLNDLPSLPTMTKTDLMAHFDVIATDPRVTRERCEKHIASGEIIMDGEYAVLASSGSSGVRALSVTRVENLVPMGRLMRFVVRWARRSGMGEGMPSMSVVAAGPGPHGSSLMRRIHGGAGPGLSVLDPLDDIVAALNAAQPEYLVVYASFIPRLLNEARAGRLRMRPRLLTPAAEPFLPEHEEAVAKVWGCAVMTSWGATEFGLLGGGSGFESGMLLYDDFAIIEPVNASGRPVPPGRTADKLFVTPLRKSGDVLPLIRYELTDQLTVLPEPAVCGSSFTRVSNVLGRLDEQFVYDRDIAVHPHVFRTVLGRVRAIHEYQVRQTERGAEIDVVASTDQEAQGTDLDASGLCSEIEGSLARLGLSRPVVHLRRVSEIPRLRGSAKLRRFVPLRGHRAPEPQLSGSTDG